MPFTLRAGRTSMRPKNYALTIGVSALLLVTACQSGIGAGGAKVTDAEYRAAAQAAAECIRAKGWEATDPEPDASGMGYGVGIGGGPKGSEREQEAVFDSCWNKHAEKVQRRFYDSLALTGSERDEKYSEFIECLEAAGVTGVEVGDPEGDVGSAISDNDEGVMCMQHYMWFLFRGFNNE